MRNYRVFGCEETNLKLEESAFKAYSNSDFRILEYREYSDNGIKTNYTYRWAIMLNNRRVALFDKVKNVNEFFKEL